MASSVATVSASGGRQRNTQPDQQQTIRAKVHREHTRARCASEHVVKGRLKSSLLVCTLPCGLNLAENEGGGPLPTLVTCWREHSLTEPHQSPPWEGRCCCSLHVIRLHFHMFLSSSLQDNCSSGAQGTGGQEVCTPVYQLTKCSF